MPLLTSFLRIPAFLSLLFAGLNLFSGCASYQLGSPSPLPFESIYVKPAGNESFAPQAQAELTTRIRERIINDARARLVSVEKDADAVLEILISDYQRKPASRDNSDTVLATDFDITLTATISLYDQNNHTYLIEDRSLSDRVNAFATNPYTPKGAVDNQSYVQAQSLATSQLARDLAQKITDEILSAWD